METELINHLLDRIKRTTRCRYHASRRLKRHHRLSQWTVAILSAALIFIPLFQVFKVNLVVSMQTLNIFQIILAVLILVYSILLGQENFYSKSKDMLRNGIELGRLVRRIEGINAEDSNKGEYDKLSEEYYNILEKYDNHEPVDYIYAKLHNKPKNKKEHLKFFYNKLSANSRTIMGVTLYLIPITFVLLVFIYLITGMYR